jgi:hypothetical protein
LAEIYLPFRAAVPISTTRQEAGSPALVVDGTGVSPSLPGFPENFVHARLPGLLAPTHYNSSVEEPTIQRRAVPRSLAATTGIAVAVFSWAE